MTPSGWSAADRGLAEMLRPGWTIKGESTVELGLSLLDRGRRDGPAKPSATTESQQEDEHSAAIQTPR